MKFALYYEEKYQDFEDGEIEMKTGIYMIRNKINNKAYIGQAVDIDFRWATHIRELNDNKHRNQYLQNSWNKYGADNFEFTIVCLCEEEELNEFEIDMIAHFDTYNNGYNLTLGGDGTRGYKYTDEQRARRSERVKESWNRPEVKAKLREALNRPEVKKKRSEAMNRPEVKAKMSEVMKEENKRRWSDPEYKAKMSKSRKGKPKSEEWKIKHSEAMKRKSTGPRSEEWKAKMSESVKEALNRPEVKKKHSEARKGKGVKSVYCVTNDTVYASGVEAGEKLGIDPGTVSRVCNGKYSSGNGHVYKKLGLEFWFLDEYEEKFGKVAM